MPEPVASSERQMKQESILDQQQKTGIEFKASLIAASKQ
jgi:hypothetical protein